MIDCVHATSQTETHVECASNRIAPQPRQGGTITRRLAVCLHPCPYRNRPNITADEMRRPQPQPKREKLPDLKPEDFPCVHRGGVLEVRTCELCGNRGKVFDVFACVVHGRCSVQTRERGLIACVACEDQHEPSSDS